MDPVDPVDPDSTKAMASKSPCTPLEVELAYFKHTNQRTSQVEKPTIGQLAEEVKSNESFQNFLGDLNLSFLQASLLQYDDEDRDLMNALTRFMESIRSSLTYPGDMINIGSSQDGTKISRLDEVDMLYVLTGDDRCQIEPTERQHVYTIRQDGVLIDPREERKKFADEIESIMEQQILPDGLEHSGYNYPGFSGVRYNGPAVTLLFNWKQDRELSVDITFVFQIPRNVNHTSHAEIMSKCKRIYEENSRRLFPVKEAYIFPNVSTNRWEVTTAHTEADLLANLSTETPFKLCIQLSKHICQSLAACNTRLIPSICGEIDVQSREREGIVQVLQRQRDTEPWQYMRYGHAFLTPEDGAQFSEMVKKMIGINSAAVKHIALRSACQLSSSFASLTKDEHNHYNLLSYLLSEVFLYLGSNQESVKHFFVHSNIGLFTVAPWLANDRCVGSLEAICREECIQLAFHLCPQRFGLEIGRNLPDKYAISQDPQCAGDNFRIQVDFAGSRCHSNFQMLLQMVFALLNTFGGLIFLNGIKQSGSKMKRWKDAFVHFIKLYLPPTLAAAQGTDHELVHVVVDTEKPYIFVHRSTLFVTMDSGISVIDCGIPKSVGDPECLAKILRKSQSSRAQKVVHKIFDQGDTLTLADNDLIHVTYWEEPFPQRKEDLQIRMLGLPLFSFSNSFSGGDIFIGVRVFSGDLIVCGQCVTELDQKEITKALNDIFSACPISGRQRIWNCDDVPWKVRFIPVLKGQQTIRNVVHIHIEGLPGGFLSHPPKSYTITKEGSIKELSYSEWNSHVNHVSQDTPDSVRDPSPTLNEDEQPTLAIGSDPKPESLSSQTFTDQDPNDNSPITKISALLENQSEISCIENIPSWQSNVVLVSRNVRQDVAKIVQSDMFVCKDPLEFTPPKAVITRECPQATSGMMDYIIQTHSAHPGFGIAASNLLSLLGVSPEEVSPDKIDILVLLKNSEIHYWSLIKEIDYESGVDENFKHLFQSALVLKRKLLAEIDGIQGQEKGILKRPNIILHCHLLYLTGDKNEPAHKTTSLLQEVLLEHAHSSMVSFQIVSCALASAFSSNNSLMKNRIGNQISLNLTAQQMEQELKSSCRQINLIEGPPGSGKTILAIRAYKRFGNAKAVFLSSNPSLQTFVQYQGVENCYVVETQGDLRSLVDRDIFGGIKCIVFDDVQHLVFNKKVWKKFFDVVLHLKAKLYAFSDSSIQSFNIVKQSDSFAYHLKRFCLSKDIPLNDRCLDEVHRNKRKIVSYIGECSQSVDTIPCSCPDDGDDVVILRMHNTTIDNEHNSLVAYIQSITQSPVQWKSDGSYLPTDIAVLVDRPHCDVTVDRYKTILSERGNYKVHGAGVFPVTGITVDSIDNFVGMDAEVVIFITSEQKRSRWWFSRNDILNRSLANGKYKSFISSRAISKVVFVTETAFSSTMAKNMCLNTEHLQRSLTKSIPEGDDQVCTEMWKVHGTPVMDTSFVETNRGPALLYVTYKDKMNMVTMDGESLSIPIDRHEQRQVISVSVSNDRHNVALLESENPYPGTWTWSIHQLSTTVAGPEQVSFIPVVSMCWTPDDEHLILIVDEKQLNLSVFPRLMKYHTSGPEVWDRKSDVTGLTVPTSATCGKDGKIFVTDWGSYVIHVFSSKGFPSHRIPQSPDQLVLRKANDICIDSSNRWLIVVHEGASCKVVSLLMMDGKHGWPLLRSQTSVYSLALFKDKFLAVGTKKGVSMHYLNNLQLIDKQLFDQSAYVPSI